MISWKYTYQVLTRVFLLGLRTEAPMCLSTICTHRQYFHNRHHHQHSNHNNHSYLLPSNFIFLFFAIRELIIRTDVTFGDAYIKTRVTFSTQLNFGSNLCKAEPFARSETILRPFQNSLAYLNLHFNLQKKGNLTLWINSENIFLNCWALYCKRLL